MPLMVRLKDEFQTFCNKIGTLKICIYYTYVQERYRSYCFNFK